MSGLTTDGRTLRADKKRRSRRSEILRAARNVFARSGYHQTRVSDIIAAADIARGTFYLYFDSKNAIFIELLDQLLDELRANVVGVERGPEAPPVELQLQRTVHQLMRTMVDNRQLTTIIIREAVGLDADVDLRLRGFYGELLSYIRESLEEGEAMGFVREMDHEVAAMCVLGTIKQFMEQLVMMKDTPAPDIDRMALQVLDYNLRGILRAPG